VVGEAQDQEISNKDDGEEARDQGNPTANVVKEARGQGILTVVAVEGVRVLILKERVVKPKAAAKQKRAPAK